MHIKKINIIAALFFLLCVPMIINVFAKIVDVKITEIRYRCKIDSYNPLYHIWFFLFEAENREFLWKEKKCLNEKGCYREIIFSNQSRVMADFFSQGNELRAMVDFAGEEWKGKLNPEQTKTWFDMLDFSRRAMPGDIYTADYKTAKNHYRISIQSRREVGLLAGANL